MRWSNDKTLALLAIAVGFAITLLTRAKPLVEDYGYDPDPLAAQQFAGTLPSPSFAEAAPGAMGREPEDTFLWRAMDAAHRARYGVPWQCSNQRNVGSCVAHGAAHAVYASEAVAWSVGERDEPPLLVHQGAIYGGARVEARGKPGDGKAPYGGYRDGATGFGAARWLRDWGVIYKRQYPSVDCTVSNPDIEKTWGAFGCGGEGDAGRLDAEAKQVPCLHVVQVRNWDELVGAIMSGHPVTLASNQGFTRRLDAQCFADPSGVWMHQMCAIGIRTDREGAAIVNSWGDYISYSSEKRDPTDLPDGVFWADRRVIERMLAQGDCWAISEVKFKYRDIHHNNWLMK